ncbi:phosphonate ABC transporter ATP-binding protein [Jeotgalibacillus sp. R-1-5s-1]|uniref:phosphonate ABC transporter ATP-binding protein n=1 Tax=Jeotgalibacillus sp. R-1-5s-1 TaxID=2555897 RepID=UPI00106A203E|nr:phosphonate ABC transporter ATP-binding protein [Jeotgalibacillus sp. R-1-5s-1]TFE00160.1 phosphonate ABC transporter ATP-binding protein [Jeotgalibacillus sp. R-1-5s-1]
MIQTHQLSVHYPNTEALALSDVTLSFSKGEFVCVLGKSGAGKSTLIRCLNGLQQPTSGKVLVNEKSLSDLSGAELREVRRSSGMIFQHFNLIPRLSVMQNVLTGSFGYRSSLKNLTGVFSKQEISQARGILKEVGLLDFEKRKVEKLSGGQKQRVGIARALMQDPSVLLGDEPVASLDPGTADQIFQLITRMHASLGLLTIINVHDVQLARQYADRIIALKDGQVVFDGEPDQFTQKEYDLTYA